MKYKCFQCGSELIVQDTWNASDISLLEEEKNGTDDDYDIYIMDCPNCGVRYEVAECPSSEREKFPFYNQQT